MKRILPPLSALLMLASPALAQAPIVGSASKADLNAEIATARANEAVASRYQTAVTSRGPTFTDDATQGFVPGNTWLADELYTNQASATGAADWQRTPNHLLPGDQIGLRLTAAALAAAGTGYAVGNTVTLTGGAVVTVATITGGGSTGPIGTVTLTSPAYHACFNGTAGGLAQIATNGGGTGATFTGSFIGPYLYGARLLTVCYKANKAIDISGALLAQTTIGFAPTGLIDYATMDSLLVGARPALLTLYDQGVNGANGTQQVGYAGTISPLRTVRGMRTIPMDGDQDGALDSGAPGSITTVNLPATVSVNTQANTLIFAGGLQSLDHRAGLLDVGYGNTAQVAIVNKATSSLPNVAVVSGTAGVGVACPGLPMDRDNVVFAVSTASAQTCTMNGLTGAAGTAAAAGTATTGNLGFVYDTNTNGGNGYVDYAAAIVVPWAMSAAEVAAADASIQTTFGMQRQPRSVIVFDGDSVPDGHGAPAQHGIVRAFGELLARPDIMIANTSYFGSTMGGAASNGAPGSRLTEQPLNVLPLLDAAYAAKAPNVVAVLSPMGGNDISRTDTVASIETSYQTYCSNVHAHHGKCIVSYFVNSPVYTYPSASYVTLSAWLAANAPGTGPGADLVIAVPPCPTNLACYQSDNVHPAPQNVAIIAQAFAQGVATVLK